MKRNFDLIKKLAMLCLLLAAVTPMFGQVTVEMKKEGGVFSLPGKVNGLQLEFIFDTGASDVYLSLTEFIFMLKNGYLTEDDIKGESYSMVASGETVRNTDVLLREIEIAGIKVYNVTASVSENLGAPLLLGQSAIQKLGPIQLEGNKLIISNGKDFPSEQKAQEYLLRGAQQVEATNYEAAIAILQRGLDISKDLNIRSGLYCNMVHAYVSLGDRKTAIEYCHKGLEENPLNQELGYNLGVYLYETGEYEQAGRAFQLHIQRFADKSSADKSMIAAAYAYLGDIQKRGGKFVEAEGNYTKSIAIAPYSQPYLGLGDIYFEQRKYAQAAENYEKGIAYEPHRPSNIIRYNQLGLSYLYSKQHDKAQKAFKDCIKAFMNVVEFWVEAMDSARASGDKEAQMRYADMMIANTDSELWLARMTTDAKEVYDYYSSLFNNPLFNPANFAPNDYIRFSIACSNLGDKENAEKILRKANSLFPEDVNILFRLSFCYDDADPERISLLKKILTYEHQVKPRWFDYGTVYNNIAWGYCCQKQYKEGLPYAEKAVALNPEHGYSWETLGELYFYCGKYNECIKAMTDCMTCEGYEKCKEAFIFRGRAYLKLGQKRKGQADLDAAANL